MKKSFFFICIVIFFVSCSNNVTYRVRPIGESSMFIEQNEIKGLRAGDTVQLKMSIFYPYDYSIVEGASQRIDTAYFSSYVTSSGDTAGYLVSKKIAVIESIEQ